MGYRWLPPSPSMTSIHMSCSQRLGLTVIGTSLWRGYSLSVVLAKENAFRLAWNHLWMADV